MPLSNQKNNFYILVFKNILITVIFLNGLLLSAQEGELYTWFDHKIGLENTDLYNGIEFINPYNLNENKHRFFKTNLFQNGSVKYNNQIYYNVALRYDIYEDLLFVKLETKSGIANQILLLKESLDGFTIGNSIFQKVKVDKATDEQFTEFYELLTKNDHVKLYKKNQKKLNKIFKNGLVYHEFTADRPEYFILTEDDFFQIQDKRDLISKYPKYKKDLSNFKWSSNDYQANDRQLISAINKLGQILNQ